MRKRNTTPILFFVIMISAVCLAACGTGQPASQYDEQIKELEGQIHLTKAK